jgi:hypothetical protein
VTKNLTPLEHEEQVEVVKWITTQNDIAALFKARNLTPVLFSAIANGHYQQSRKQQNKLKAEGMNSGVPDLLFIIPPERSKNGKRLMIWIEMKRQQGGSVSVAQQQWIDAIDAIDGGNVGAFVCYGADEAIDVLKDLIIVL